MLGIVEQVSRREEAVIRVEEAAGLRLVYGGALPPKGGAALRWRRQTGHIRKAFSAWGVRRVLLPEGEGWRARFSQWSPVDPMPFCRDIADLLAISMLEGRGISPGRAVVTLRAPRISREVEAAAGRLAAAVRGVALDIPGEGDRLAALLRREYGMAVYPPEQGDVTVDLGRGRGAEGGSIDLSGGGAGALPLKVEAPGLALPEEYALPILSVLWECGRLKRGQIRVYWANDGISS